MPVAPILLLGVAIASASPTIVSAQLPSAAPEAVPTASAIMARVAANQDRAEAERSHYTYIQHARVVSRKGHTVMCEEITESRITPSPTGSKADLLKLDGRLLRKHKYVSYTALPPTRQNTDKTAAAADHDMLNISLGDDDTDRSLVESMRSSLTNDDSKDGINQSLFPLTSTGQSRYTFQLLGREHINGRDTFHIVFRPIVKDDFGWKGDAYIDTTAFEPVAVSTALARKVPFAVRTLLGTNLPGLGFTVLYAPQPDGTWFPVSFGNEFKLHVLFFFSREIIIDAQNRAFEKTHVHSTLLPSSDSAQNPPQPPAQPSAPR